MAGDWIKMRVDLPDDPAVIAIAEATGLDEDAVVGKLHRLWSWADRHTDDGHAPTITARWVNKYVGHSGFAEAMAAADWISFDSEGVHFPDFSKHNGLSAKKRAENTTRQRLSRDQRDNGETGDARDVIPRGFRSTVLKRDEYRCVFCGTQSDQKREESKKRLLSIDHLIPATRGGRTTIPNLVSCCKLCNAEKNDRTPEEWGMELSFLSDSVTYLNGEVRDKRATNARREQRTEEQNTEDLSVSVISAGTVNHRGKSKPAAPLSAVPAEIINFEIEDIQFTASLAFKRADYRGSDGAIFWKMAALAFAGKISEFEYHDTLDAAKTNGKSKPSFARGCLRKMLARRAKPVDADALLKSVRIKPECPKSAPTIPELEP